VAPLETGKAVRIPGLEQQPVFGIEAGVVVHDRTPTRLGTTGHASLRIMVLVGIPSVGGDLCDEVVSAQHRLPQQLG